MAITVEVVLSGTYLGQDTALVRHYRSASAIAMPTAADLCQDLATQWENTIGLYLTASSFSNFFTIREAGPGTVSAPYTPTGWPFEGTLVEMGCPSFVCVYSLFTGATYTKPVHGSARISGSPVSALDGNQWSDTYYDDIESAWQDYFLYSPTTSGGAGAWAPVIYSRTLDSYNIISSVGVQRNIGHQTSRHIGHGG